MSERSLKEQSRKDWVLSHSQDKADNEQIQIGCLLRIADASEAMAKNHNELISQRDMYQRWHQDAFARLQRSERRLAATKGVVTKQRRRIEELERKLSEVDYE